MDICIEKAMEQTTRNVQSVRDYFGNLLGQICGFANLNTMRKTQTALQTYDFLNLTYVKGESCPNRLTSKYSTDIIETYHQTYKDDVTALGLRSKNMKTSWKERL